MTKCDCVGPPERELIKKNLLRQDGSLFKNLCEKSGKYRDLYKAAERKEKEDKEDGGDA